MSDILIFFLMDTESNYYFECNIVIHCAEDIQIHQYLAPIYAFW